MSRVFNEGDMVEYTGTVMAGIPTPKGKIVDSQYRVEWTDPQFTPPTPFTPAHMLKKSSGGRRKTKRSKKVKSYY